jgi:hypothetical protein
LSAGSEGRRPASDALSRAPPRRPLGFDAQRPAGKSSKDRLRSPRRQARRSSPVQSAWIATLRSTSTAPDRLKPFLHRRYATSQWRCPPGLSPCRTIVECDPGGVELLAESRQSSFLGTGPDRLAPHRCRPSRDPRGITLDVHYPGPLGSDTFCRRLVEPPAGEADTSWRSRAVREPTSGFAAYRRPAFARPAASQPAFAGRLARGPASRVPPRRGPRSAEPKVSSIREEHLRQG